MKRRQERERAFHDEVYEDPESGPMAEGGRGRFYLVARSLGQRYGQRVMEAARNSTCLEYGCGTGERSLEVAAVARRVTGFDISGVAIDRANQAAADAGVADKASFEVQGAESLPYADGTFDVVFGNSVLHHLDLATAIPEMVRVMRSGATAIFLEPMGHNPIINLYRRRTPHMRTPDERPFRREDLKRLQGAFLDSDFEFSAFLSLASIVIPRRSVDLVEQGLERMDRALLGPRSPLRHYAWLCLMALRAR